MSSSQKAEKATRNRRRRAQTKKQLKILRQKAGVPGATTSVKKEYNAAARKRTNLLKYDKDRSKARRNNLKSDIAAGKRCALEKASRLKIAKRLSYAKRRKNGRVKALKAQRRAVVKIQFIKSELDKGKNINGW